MAVSEVQAILSTQFPQVDRCSNLSRREFRREYLYPGRPVVITDVTESWPARSRWSLEYFRSHCGETDVTVFCLGGARYEPADTQTMALSSFIEKIQTSSFDEYRYYIRDDWRIFVTHKELLA